MKSTRISKSQYAVSYPNIVILVSKDHSIKKSEGWSFKADVSATAGDPAVVHTSEVKYWTKGAALEAAATMFAEEIALGQRLEAEAKAAAKAAKKTSTALQPVVTE